MGSKLALAFTHLPPDSPDLSFAWSLKALSYIWDTDTESAVEAGRLAYLAGRMPKRRYADPSSPLAGII